MKRHRLTIARCLGWTAILAANMALIQSMGVRRVCDSCDFILVALQVGLWGFIRSHGRLRRFWAGFMVPSTAAVLVLLLCPPPLLERFLTPYTDITDELTFRYVPNTLLINMGDHYWGLELAIVYFVPVFVAALLGGLIAAWLIPRSLTPARTVNREGSTAVVG